MLNLLNFKPAHRHLKSILACCVALPPASVLTIPHGIGITGPIVILVSLLFLFSRQGKATPLQTSDRWLLLALCLYPAIIFINILFHNDEFKYDLFDYPLRFLIVIPVFLTLRRFKLPAQCLYFGFGIGAIGAGFIAIYQRFYLGLLQTNGFVFHISFGDLSILLGFMSLCAWPLVMNSSFTKTGLFFILSAFSLGITGSILSTARGGWLAAPILFLLIINKYITNTVNRIGISIVFLSICLGLYAVNENINTRINLGVSEIITYFNHSYTGDLTVNSVGSRMEMWKVSWMMFKHNPWSGIGTGNYYKVTGELIKSGKMRTGTHHHHAHSDYMNLLAETGIPGLFSLMFLYGVSWYYFSHGFKKHNTLQNDTLKTSGQLLIAGYAVFSLTQSSLNHNVTTFFLAIMIATLAGMISRESGLST